jgi:hypothetical protein
VHDPSRGIKARIDKLQATAPSKPSKPSKQINITIQVVEPPEEALRPNSLFRNNIISNNRAPKALFHGSTANNGPDGIRRVEFSTFVANNRQTTDSAILVHEFLGNSVHYLHSALGRSKVARLQDQAGDANLRACTD